MKIPLNEILIDFSANNSRVGFDHDEWVEDCQGLADTISQSGQIQPVSVVRIEDQDYQYKLVFGYRRCFAIEHILGYTTVEAYISDKPPDVDPLDNLIENLARKDLTYWESCVGLKRTMDPDLSYKQVAKIVGKSHGWAYHRWGVWKLPPEVIDQVEAGWLTASDVSLLMAKAESEQLAAAKAIADAKARGETNQTIGRKLGGRKTVRPKKEVQKMMNQFMAEDKMGYVHVLRWAVGEIDDPQLEELL